MKIQLMNIQLWFKLQTSWIHCILLQDIHYLAKDKGEVALSEVAYQKAQQIDTASFTSDSFDDSQEDEDEIDDSLDESEDGDDDSVDIIPPTQMHPPPLPPVSTFYTTLY